MRRLQAWDMFFFFNDPPTTEIYPLPLHAALPILPPRIPYTWWGAWDMAPMPPATTHCSSPALIAWAASITALSPEPQTLLIVSEGIVPGRPAWIAAWRAGAWPSPPWSTLPRMTSSTRAASTPARRTASLITSAPRRGAGIGASPPRYLPTGVRQADRITGMG